MAGVWNFLQWRLVLGDTVLILFYVFLKNWVSVTLLSGTLKQLIKSSMKCSFCIWLARNNKDRTPSAVNCKLNGSSKETCNSASSLSSIKQTTQLVANEKSIRIVCFINKGNTCSQISSCKC